MNPNEVPRYGLSQKELDQLFERAGEQLVAAAEARQQAAAWPGVIERVLGWLWRRSTAHHEALLAAEARIAALEAKMGLRQG